MLPFKRLLAVAAVLLLLPTLNARAQIFGTNTGTFADWIQSYAVDSVPFRWPGALGSGYNAAAPGAVSGIAAPVITGDVGLF
jgi:hypothetical protein